MNKKNYNKSNEIYTTEPNFRAIFTKKKKGKKKKK